jgi:natural product precursor
MKSKKFEKKLVLNKNTIAHLSYEELVKLKGGMNAPPSSACGTICGGWAC